MLSERMAAADKVLSTPLMVNLAVEFTAVATAEPTAPDTTSLPQPSQQKCDYLMISKMNMAVMI